MFDKEKDAFACSCNPQWSGEKCELGKFLVFLSLIINIRDINFEDHSEKNPSPRWELGLGFFFSE